MNIGKLVRENLRTAQELDAAIPAKKAKKVNPRRPVRCTRVLEGERGVDLTAADIDAWLPLVPGDAIIRPDLSYSGGAYVGLYSTPDVMHGLTATWYEDRP